MDDFGYLWISLLMTLFAKPNTIVNPEKIKENMNEIKRVVKESGFDFNNMTLETMNEKSQEIYNMIEKYLS